MWLDPVELKEKRQYIMAKIFYLHFHEQELSDRIAPLVAAGHDVRAHASTKVTAKWGEYLPEVVVISLDRLPSHGRAYAAWIWEAKKRQNIPIVFVDGAPDKVAIAMKQFPRAKFCSTSRLLAMLKK
jgi:hypothetical protein